MPNRYWIAASGAFCAALLGLWLSRPAAIRAADAEQPRLSEPAPIPQPGDSLSQTFTARHNGLSAIDVLAVYHGQPADQAATLTLRLWDAAGTLLAEATHQGFEHNASLRLEFDPLPGSAGQTYRLEVTGSAKAQTTLWAYHLDGYQGGALHQGSERLPGDLRFATTYTYLWPDMLRDTLGALISLIGLAVPLWLVLFVPGLLVLDVLKVPFFDQSRWARWGGALALSLAVLPLAWLWTTTVGVAWSRMALAAVYAGMGALVAGRWMLVAAREILRRRVRVRAAAWPGSQPVPVRFASPAPYQPRLTGHDAALAALLLLGVVLRLLAVRDLALPAWVDSSHHALVARVMAESGRLPAGQFLLLNLDQFAYHFGAHAVLVALGWFSPLAATDTMLVAGQVLNGLMPLSIYAGTVALAGRRPAALGAAFFVALVSFFPAYYATWGRYSQLVGLLVLTPAMGAVWSLLAAISPATPGSGRSSPMTWRLVVGVGLLAAGLLLAHYRVFLFYLLFIVVAWLLHARAGMRSGQWLAAAAGVGALMALPWVGRLLTRYVIPFAGQPELLAAASGYNEFPANYFNSPLERGAFALSAAAGVWGLVRREKVIWALGLWTGGIFALLHLGATWVVNNNAWAISLFVPVAVVLGWGLDRWLQRSRQLLAAPSALLGPLSSRQLGVRRGAGTFLLAAAAGLLAYAGLAGGRLQVSILNPITVLATTEDRLALDWVAANTPSDAVFLINGWNWLGESWTGSDGGAWVMPYAGRRATLPPVTYGFGSAGSAAAVHDLAAQVAQIVSADDPVTLELLRTTGVTHVFIGARGGTLKPEMFVASQRYRLVYTNGAAWVFEVVNLAP